MTTANQEQRRKWNGDSGDVWVDIEPLMDRQLAPLGRAAMDLLAPRAGEHILDIGCGAGQTSLDLADAVTENGTVLGLDISSQLVGRARHRAAGRTNLSFAVDDAQVHPFVPGAFDALFSRFGVMFFDDPVAAFRNLLAALKPGGRIAFVCWRSPEENPVFTLPLQAARPFLDLPSATPDPTSPGPFAFQDPDRIRQILADAGFANVDIIPRDIMVSAGNADDFTALSLKVGSLGPALKTNPGQTEPVKAALRKAYREHSGPNGISLPAAVWIVRAIQPA
jgi:SAM-dependent methyltransferase